MECNITHFESREVICSQKGVHNRFKGARFLTVFGSGDKYADNCVRTLLFSKVIALDTVHPSIALGAVLRSVPTLMCYALLCLRVQSN